MTEHVHKKVQQTKSTAPFPDGVMYTTCPSFKTTDVLHVGSTPFVRLQQYSGDQQQHTEFSTFSLDSVLSIQLSRQKRLPGYQPSPGFHDFSTRLFTQSNNRRSFQQYPHMKVNLLILERDRPGYWSFVPMKLAVYSLKFMKLAVYSLKFRASSFIDLPPSPRTPTFARRRALANQNVWHACVLYIVLLWAHALLRSALRDVTSSVTHSHLSFTERRSLNGEAMKKGAIHEVCWPFLFGFVFRNWNGCANVSVLLQLPRWQTPLWWSILELFNWIQSRQHNCQQPCFFFFFFFLVQSFVM